MKIVIVLSLVQGILAGAIVSESTFAEAVCEGGWKVIDFAHVVGGMPQPDISDVDGCKAECVDDCTGIDWNFSGVPYQGVRCWIHTSTYQPMQIQQNERVIHFMKCSDEESLPTMADVDNAACNMETQPAVLMAPSGMISYPVSGNYPSYSVCSWRIDGPVGMVITIHFSRFLLENSFDFLRVHDGDSTASTVLGTLTGIAMPSDFTSSGNVLFIRFTSDGSENFAGFELTYSTSTLEETTDGEESLPTMEDVNNAACSTDRPAVLMGPSGMISYPVSGNYAAGATCTWRIDGPAGTVITIHFTRFQMERYYDTLSVYDGDSNASNRLGLLSGLLSGYGSPSPSDLTSTGNVLFIRFTSDGSSQFSGFELTYSTATRGEIN